MKNLKSISSNKSLTNPLMSPFKRGFMNANLILLIASIKCPYIPVINAIVPPETPGTISAEPIKSPLIKIKIASLISKLKLSPYKIISFTYVK